MRSPQKKGLSVCNSIPTRSHLCPGSSGQPMPKDSHLTTVEQSLIVGIGAILHQYAFGLLRVGDDLWRSGAHHVHIAGGIVVLLPVAAG